MHKFTELERILKQMKVKKNEKLKVGIIRSWVVRHYVVGYLL